MSMLCQNTFSRSFKPFRYGKLCPDQKKARLSKPPMLYKYQVI